MSLDVSLNTRLRSDDGGVVDRALTTRRKLLINDG